MKIGDEVRFLNEVGGGKVVAFRDKNVVLVKDGDGFEIPMLINEVVVVESDSYDRKFNAAKAEKPVAPPKSETVRREKTADVQAAAGGFHAERREGEKLNIYMAFVPVNPEDMVSTTFDTYTVSYTHLTLPTNSLV